MNEAHFSEIEKVLLYVSEARERAGRAATSLAKGDAEGHLVACLEAAETDLRDLHRRIMQGTYFAVPADEHAEQERLAV